MDKGERVDTLDHNVSEEMETDVQSRVGGSGRDGNLEDGGQGISTTKNLLGWGSSIKIGDIGFSAFGAGLNRCDSV
jgi:hypothetical protein